MKTHDDYTPFRQSMAKVLLTKSLATLKHQLDEGKHRHSRQTDTGTACHQLVLGGRWYETLSYPDYRTKEARERRDSCHARGITPMLKREIEPLEQFAGAVKLYLFQELGVVVAHESVEKEETLSWTHRVDNKDGSTFRHLRCEGTPDCVDHANRVVIDLKFGEGMSQDDRERQVYSMAYDVQAAAYLEAVDAQDTQRGLQSKPPYAYVLVCGDPDTGLITHHEMSESYLQVGQKRWDEACEKYARAIDGDFWPYYAPGKLFPPARALNGLFGVKGIE